MFLFRRCSQETRRQKGGNGEPEMTSPSRGDWFGFGSIQSGLNFWSPAHGITEGWLTQKVLL